MKKIMATFYKRYNLQGLDHVELPFTVEVAAYDGYTDIMFIKNTEFIRLGTTRPELYPEDGRTAVLKKPSIKLQIHSNSELEPAFGYTPVEIKKSNVEITKSNTSFVKVGEKTHISTMQDGTQYLWSDFCQRYERLSWATRLWCVEYKEITK